MMETTIEPYKMEFPDGENGVNWTEYRAGNHITHSIIENAYLGANRHNDGTFSLTFAEKGKFGEIEVVLSNSDALALAKKISGEFKVHPCPFCGKDVRLTHTSVECDRCGVKMQIHDSTPVDVLIEVWNRRASNE